MPQSESMDVTKSSATGESDVILHPIDNLEPAIPLESLLARKQKMPMEVVHQECVPLQAERQIALPAVALPAGAKVFMPINAKAAVDLCGRHACSAQSA